MSGKGIMALMGLAILSFSASAQRVNNLTGQVLDSETGNPLEFASVGIFSLPDSTLVSAGLTSTEGAFELSAPTGEYYAIIKFISYADQIIQDIEVSDGQRMVLDKIELNVTSSYLDEVTVQGERTQMEMTLDKKIYNIGKDLSNLGGSATDILDNLPSVQVACGWKCQPAWER